MLFIFLTVDEMEKEELVSRIRKIKNGNNHERESLIKDYTPLIIKTVSQTTGKYVQQGDCDEFSVAMIAFNEAIDSFDTEKGYAFIPFVKLIIKRRLIDYIRKTGRLDNEMSFSQIDDEDGIPIEDRIVDTDRSNKADQFEIKQDILRFKEALKEFKITFSDLVNDCPKHNDTRELCFKLSRTLIRDDELKNELFAKKTLPIKLLLQQCNISRKTIERHRKYIIAVSVILSGDFESIKDYIEIR